MDNVVVGGECLFEKKALPNALWTVWFDLVSLFRFVAAALLGGEKCMRCGRERNSAPLCDSCAKFIKTSAVFENRCKVCGKPLVSQIGLCSYCKTKPVLKSVDSVFPLEAYQLWKKELLFSWKSEGKRSLSRFFADFVVCGIKKLIAEKKLDFSSGDPLFIVPVPPRPGKIRKKGWDQIEEVCFYLEREHGIVVLRLLNRIGRKQQKKLGMAQRLETIGRNYCMKDDGDVGRICGKIGGLPKTVVLLDDVLTTGATIENCAEVLKEKGVEKVFAVTLFGV